MSRKAYFVSNKNLKILKRVRTFYLVENGPKNLVGMVEDIDENGELFESSPSRYILSIQGGLNGNGKWPIYLKDVEYVVSILSKRFISVKLYDWKNDVLDDVWNLKLVLGD